MIRPLFLLAVGTLAYGLLLAGVGGGMTRGPSTLEGLSRKSFHVGIFTGAVPAQLLLGFWGVAVYGAVVASLVLFAFCRGPRSSLYLALARTDDGGEGGRFVLLPLLSTALGGLASVVLVGEYAVVGYLVCGWGDAAGEVVGRRWGRRHYSSPLPWVDGTHARSLEGSMGVLGAGFLGAATALVLLGHPFSAALVGGVTCGTAGAVSEGLSGHGTDNFWVQLLPSLLGWWLLG